MSVIEVKWRDSQNGPWKLADYDGRVLAAMASAPFFCVSGTNIEEVERAAQRCLEYALSWANQK